MNEGWVTNWGWKIEEQLKEMSLCNKHMEETILEINLITSNIYIDYIDELMIISKLTVSVRDRLGIRYIKLIARKIIVFSQTYATYR